MRWKLFFDEGLDILQQLQVEEYLLRSSKDNYILINYGSAPAFILGRSAKAEEALSSGKLPHRLLRRFTGGGNVYIDAQCCFISFILNGSALPFPCHAQSLLEWSAGLYQKIFPPGPFGFRENDYVWGKHKCGGNAQAMRQNRWVHHTSFPWTVDLYMDHLRSPKRQPLYRAKRSHRDFLHPLEELFPSPDFFCKKAAQYFGSFLSAERLSSQEKRELLQASEEAPTRNIDLSKN